MGRDVKRVPLDFDHPRNEVWPGFLMPDILADEEKCVDCENGYSPRAQELHDLWYGHRLFHPEDNGSTPLTPDTPAVRAFAERNVKSAPGYYGSGEAAIRLEGERLATMWNGQWNHHLNADDVAALVAGDRLWDLTHTWTRETRWQPKDPFVVPTPDEVNDWNIRSMGHDGINASVVVRARCWREGVPVECGSCGGHSTHERYPGQRDAADAWEPTEPPDGDGWQLWETVSEGSPISPVFPDAEGLAQWLTTPDACWGAMDRPMTIEQARGFVGAGWAPSLIGNAGGIHEGAEYIGTEEALRGHDL